MNCLRRQWCRWRLYYGVYHRRRNNYRMQGSPPCSNGRKEAHDHKRHIRNQISSVLTFQIPLILGEEVHVDMLFRTKPWHVICKLVAFPILRHDVGRMFTRVHAWRIAVFSRQIKSCYGAYGTVLGDSVYSPSYLSLRFVWIDQLCAVRFSDAEIPAILALHHRTPSSCKNSQRAYNGGNLSASVALAARFTKAAGSSRRLSFYPSFALLQDTLLWAKCCPTFSN